MVDSNSVGVFLLIVFFIIIFIIGDYDSKH